MKFHHEGHIFRDRKCFTSSEKVFVNSKIKKKKFARQPGAGSERIVNATTKV